MVLLAGNSASNRSYQLSDGAKLRGMVASKSHKRKASLLGVGLGLLVALVMLFPIGGRFQTTIEPGGTKEAVLADWSLGSLLLWTPLVAEPSSS
jgi:hypothetical protein